MCSSGEALATKMSSMQLYTKSTSLTTSSMKRCKVLATFRNPKSIVRNSNAPNGVVTAVLGMSAGFIGI